MQPDLELSHSFGCSQFITEHLFVLAENKCACFPLPNVQPILWSSGGRKRMQTDGIPVGKGIRTDDCHVQRRWWAGWRESPCMNESLRSRGYNAGQVLKGEQLLLARCAKLFWKAIHLGTMRIDRGTLTLGQLWGLLQWLNKSGNLQTILTPISPAYTPFVTTLQLHNPVPSLIL